jgi:hypothetical protein
MMFVTSRAVSAGPRFLRLLVVMVAAACAC